MDSELTKSITRAAIQKAFRDVEIKKKEKEIVGEFLISLHETEQYMAFLLATWFNPFVKDVHSDLQNIFLLPTSTFTKIEYLVHRNLLPKSLAKKAKAIYQLRNSIAHPRPEDQRVIVTIQEQK